MTFRRLTLATALAGLLGSPATAQDVRTIAEDLDYPWDVEVHGGSVYMTEKKGNLVILEGGALRRATLQTSLPTLDDRGGGLLGMALRPDFATSRRIVLYQHVGTANDRTNRVIEAVLDGGTLRETRVLLDGVPGHPLYNGGRVAFGPDGMLYVTTGWTENRALPQDPDSLAGKILRLTPDGAIPPDNPFPGSPVWSLGHRNPQGLAWNAEGTLFAAEHGQSGHDEVNRIEPGGNYGWPVVQGDENGDGFTPPLAQSGGTTWAPSGLAWDGERLLVAGLRAEGILGVRTDGAVSVAHDIGERTRDIAVTDDGIYYITTSRSPRGDGPSRDRLVLIPD
ncbi:MAG: PQQ-dependent sugar dehydrogenase [Pseudooceanicola sp.]